MKNKKLKIKKPLPKAKGKLRLIESIRHRRLQIPIHIATMPDVLNDNLLVLCIDLIDDTIISLRMR